MANQQVLIVDPIHGPTQQALEDRFDCIRLYEADDHDALLSTLSDTLTVVVTHSGYGISPAQIRALPRLGLVANFGVGIDTIDVADCTAHDVRVSNTPDVLTEDVADMALALLLATVRQIPRGDQYVRTGQWLRKNMWFTDTLQQRRVGIVGLGRIGRAIARRCEAFNTAVAYTGPNRKSDAPYEYHEDIIALAQWADVLIAACPGGPATAGLVSADALSALGERGVFVNIARGSVVDQNALVSLLQSGQLGGAGLDVFADEPNVPDALVAMEHVVLQPHQGSATVPTRMAMGQMVIDNVAAWFDQKPLISAVN